METLEVVYLILALFSLLVCAFFSSAEIGFIKLQRIRLKHLQEEEVPGSVRVARIMEHPERFLSTVLTGISFAETIVVSLGTIFIVALLGESVGTPVAIVIIAIVLLIFAKVIPKTIAAQHPERIALLYGRPIELIARVLSPMVNGLSLITALITRTGTMPRALIKNTPPHSIGFGGIRLTRLAPEKITLDTSRTPRDRFSPISTGSSSKNLRGAPSSFVIT